MTCQADGSFVGSRKSRSQFNNHAQSTSAGTAGKAIVMVAMAAFTTRAHRPGPAT
jgi:hypothetical protein